MRRWLLLGAGLVAAAVAAVAIAAMRLNDYLQAHRDELAARASLALGRRVTFDTVRVSLRDGGSARLTGLRVGDDPRFGPAPFLEAASATVSLALLDAVRGRLRIRSVAIDAPRLRLERDADGWNVESLVPLRARRPEIPPTAAPGPADGDRETTASGRRVDALHVRDGEVTLTDRSRQPPVTFTSAQMDVRLSQPAAPARLQLAGTAALAGAPRPNATFDGQLLAGAPPSAEGQLRWDALPIAALQPLLAGLGVSDLHGDVSGALRFSGPLAVIGGGHLGELLAAVDGSLELHGIGIARHDAALRVDDFSGALRIDGAALELTGAALRIGDAPVRALSATATLRGEAAELGRLAASAFGGTVQASARCTGVTTPAPACATDVAGQHLQVAAMLGALRGGAAARVDGTLDTAWHLATTGLDTAALRRSARGTGSIQVVDGVVRNLNLAQRVLGALPGVDVRRAGGRGAALLGGSETRFQRLSATVRIADEHARSDDLVLAAADFSVAASGSVAFDGGISARGTLRAAAPLVADLGREIPVLGRLTASTEGLIAVPFSVRGTLATPRVEPDLAAVAGEVGHGVAQGLEALFGAPDRARDKPGGVLRQGLDKIFGR